MDANYSSRTLAVKKNVASHALFYDFIPIFTILLASLLLSIQLRTQIFPNILFGSDQITAPINIVFYQPVNGTGWHPAEDQFTWMSDTRATVGVDITGQEYTIIFQAGGITPEILDSLSLSINGQEIPLTRSEGEDELVRFSGVIPENTVDKPIITTDTDLVFEVKEVTSPEALGISIDNRMLGAKFKDLQIIPTKTAAGHSLLFFVIIGIATATITIIKNTIEQSTRVRKRHRLILVYGGILFTLILLRLMLPNFAIIQLFYFTVAGVIISFLVIRAPTIPKRNVFFHLDQLWKNRILLAIWTRYNIRSRYSQTFLGILWIMIQPLATALILSFVFSQILKAVNTRGAPYTSFYMSAIIPWVLFSTGLMNGMNSVIGALGLVTQVYFPREILILVKISETLVDVLFTFMAMLLVNVILGVWPNINFIYLPVLLFIQTILMLGISFYASYLAVMIRDIPQLVAIVLQLLFYLTPILYPLSSLPERFAFVGILNPLSPIVGAYRDIILYNRAPDPVSLYYTIIISGVFCYTGYMNFKRNEKRLADYI